MKRNNKICRVIAAMLISVMVTISLSGCGEKNTKSGLTSGTAENEILTLAPVDQNKELVTIHFEYGLNNAGALEQTIEKQFPNVDVVMVHDGGNDSTSLLEGNLREGTACDLIFSRVIQKLTGEPQDYFFDLSGEEFVNNFHLTSLDTCIQPDGGLYYLPGPSNLYGIIYDKTVMEENGWEVPTSYTEFVELIQTIDHSGLTVIEKLDGETKEVPVRAIRPSMKFFDSFRIQLYPFVYQQIFAGQHNVEWIVGFQNGEASLIGHAEPLAEMMKKLVADGVLRLDDWDYMPRYRLPMLAESHSTVMIYGPLSVMTENTIKNSDHEYAVMPIFAGDEPGSDYLYSIPNYFMAVSKASAEVSPEREQLLLDIMGYINAKEAQNRLFGDDNVLVTNIKDVTPAVSASTSGIQKTIREGRIITDFFLTAEPKLNTEARDMLTGNMTVEQWLKDGDLYRDEYLKGITMYDPDALGTCEETLTKLDTALMMGQVYRDVTGADIGLVYVNTAEQGANCRLFAGTLNTKAVRNMAPDRTSAEGEGIASGTMTGQQIMDCLNGMAGIAGELDSWYYVASGLKVEFAPWMPAGERLVSCKLPDGSDLDPNGTYKVAYMSDKLFCKDGGNISSLELADEEIVEGKWEDIFPTWFADQGGVLKRPEQTTVLNWKTKE